MQNGMNLIDRHPLSFGVMATSQPISVSALFAHPTRIAGLLSDGEAQDLAQNLSGIPHSGLHVAMRALLLERAVAHFVDGHSVASISERLDDGTIAAGQLAWIDQGISFRGQRKALDQYSQGRTGRTSFTTRVHGEMKVFGNFDVAYLLGSTAESYLTGTAKISMLGYVRSLDDAQIEFEPVFIGWRNLNQ
jgi:hypothetical protein